MGDDRQQRRDREPTAERRAWLRLRAAHGGERTAPTEARRSWLRDRAAE